jgi:hypothetical protein
MAAASAGIGTPGSASQVSASAPAGTTAAVMIRAVRGSADVVSRSKPTSWRPASV